MLIELMAYNKALLCVLFIFSVFFGFRMIKNLFKGQPIEWSAADEDAAKLRDQGKHVEADVIYGKYRGFR